MIVVVVACGDRLQETLTMIKSAVMFTRTDVMFIVITEDALIDSFEEKVCLFVPFLCFIVFILANVLAVLFS